MAERREQITVPLDPTLRARLEEFARAQERTLAAQVRRFCLEGLERQPAQERAA